MSVQNNRNGRMPAAMLHAIPRALGNQKLPLSCQHLQRHTSCTPLAHAAMALLRQD